MVALCAITLIASDPKVLTHQPMEILVVLVAIVAATTVAATLRDADLESRGNAITDPLTGMLNRHALPSRTAELEHQSRLTGQPVAVIMADIDHFKAVNDGHGHATGDAVLAPPPRCCAASCGPTTSPTAWAAKSSRSSCRA